jgi:glucose/arabinose dehydrogenase
LSLINRSRLLIIIILVSLISACDVSNQTGGETVRPTSPPLAVTQKQTATPMPVCTPPPCSKNESYHCPDECIGGCGTVCATHTPTPLTEDAVIVETDNIWPASVQTFPDTSEFHWMTVASGLDKPLGLIHAGDGSGRLFIIEQEGLIHIFQNGELIPDPFIDIRDRVEDSNNEQGLLGLAFHPSYAKNGLFFVNYTGRGGDTNISKFSVSSDANIADPDSETILLRIKQPFANHNGGHLLFGSDGYLYIGTGDGGSGGDPDGNAQNLYSLLGKMLRIDVDHGEPYAVPADNPYAYGGGRPEIWAIGLRNPWRYSFDRATGDLYIADVGQNKWEEINYLAANNTRIPSEEWNYGWDYWEAAHPFEGTPPAGIMMLAPIWEYDHSKGCSITGGIVYRGTFPEWQGIYIYGDFCNGTIWGLLRDPQGDWMNSVLFQTGSNITSFGEDESGELFMVDRSGDVFQLVKSL